VKLIASILALLLLSASLQADEYRYTLWSQVPWDQVDIAGPGETVPCVIWSVDVYRDTVLLELADPQRVNATGQLLAASQIWIMPAAKDESGTTFYWLIFEGAVELPTEHPNMANVILSFDSWDAVVPDMSIDRGSIVIPEPSALVVLSGLILRRRVGGRHDPRAAIAG
jgi:hypothetical protein